MYQVRIDQLSRCLQRHLGANHHGFNLCSWRRPELRPLQRLTRVRHRSTLSGTTVASSSGTTSEYDADVAVIGGGIVGLATAREILGRYPHAHVAVVEKESQVAQHQTKYNSGVIHAGMYYKPGSSMARLCVEGAKKMYSYCEARQIPHRRVGKLIVAACDEELPLLDDVYRRGQENGVEGLEIIDSEQIRKLEPNVIALRALHSPNTGIVDYETVAKKIAEDVIESGRGVIRTGFEVTRIGTSQQERGGVALWGQGISSPLRARYLITCAGLHADTVAQLAGGAREPIITPFRGSYQILKPEVADIVERNIYPVPNPKFPVLGIHFTPKMDGRMLLGPNAALALSREGYKFWQFNPREFFRYAMTPGVARLVLGNLQVAFHEIWREINPRAFIAEAQRYCPSLKVGDTVPGKGLAGVQAKAVGGDGSLIGDFVFEKASDCVLNVRNAPSPACTASLAIASDVVDRMVQDFSWGPETFHPKKKHL